MSQTGCCGTAGRVGANVGYEVVRIEQAKSNCRLCDDYAERQKEKPVAVICCEGACLRGEIARQAANILCHTLVPGKTVRICLGGAFTKDTGQRDLVRKASRLIALEGCFVNCSSRMMSGVIEGLKPDVVIADRLCDFDRKLFGIEEMPAGQIQALARVVAEKIAFGYGIGEKSSQREPGEFDRNEWIESIDAPILLMQGNPRQVVTANRRALDLFGKNLHEVEGRRGGQVFDCIHAFTEAGCGKDGNCEGCRIRDGIIDTFATGKPHQGISSPLQIKKASGTMIFELEVSTAKIGDLALVRIDRFEKSCP